MDVYTPELKAKADEVSKAIIGAAIEVHRTLGPGLLESAYEECFATSWTCAESVTEGK